MENSRDLKMIRLRAAIAEGDEAIARGEFTELNSDDELDAYFAEICRQEPSESDPK